MANSSTEVVLEVQPRFAWDVRMSLLKPLLFLGPNVLLYPCCQHIGIYSFAAEEADSYKPGDQPLGFLTRNYPSVSRKMQEEALHEIGRKDWGLPGATARLQPNSRAMLENHPSLAVSAIAHCPKTSLIAAAEYSLDGSIPFVIVSVFDLPNPVFGPGLGSTSYLPIH
jgi:hypothetical protein